MSEVLLGGQAVMEGVMMRHSKWMSIAVRDPNGNIKVKLQEVIPLTEKYRFIKAPVIRGIYTLILSLKLGFAALNYSASIALNEDEAKSTPWYMAPLMFLSIALGVAIFVIIPVWLTNMLSAYIPVLAKSSILFNLIEGIIRLLLFVGYVLGISFMPDIKRFFAYHGAEHKTIYTFEAHEALEVSFARQKSPLHPRCGTSFIMMVVLVSIVLFSFIPNSLHLAVRVGLRLLLIPLVAGISYELIRLSSTSKNQLLFRLIATPGLWIQRLTTAEPDDSMLEVAIAALSAVLNPSGTTKESSQGISVP